MLSAENSEAPAWPLGLQDPGPLLTDLTPGSLTLRARVLRLSTDRTHAPHPHAPALCLCSLPCHHLATSGPPHVCTSLSLLRGGRGQYAARSCSPKPCLGAPSVTPRPARAPRLSRKQPQTAGRSAFQGRFFTSREMPCRQAQCLSPVLLFSLLSFWTSQCPAMSDSQQVTHEITECLLGFQDVSAAIINH